MTESNSNKKNSLGKDPIFIGCILVPIIIGLSIIYYYSDGQLCSNTDCVKEFYKWSKLPLGIIASSIPLAGLYAAHFRSQQTYTQIEEQRKQNEFNNFFKHLEAFKDFVENSKYIKLLPISTTKLHTDIYKADKNIKINDYKFNIQLTNCFRFLFEHDNELYELINNSLNKTFSEYDAEKIKYSTSDYINYIYKQIISRKIYEEIKNFFDIKFTENTISKIDFSLLLTEFNELNIFLQKGGIVKNYDKLNHFNKIKITDNTFDINDQFNPLDTEVLNYQLMLSLERIFFTIRVLRQIQDKAISDVETYTKITAKYFYIYNTKNITQKLYKDIIKILNKLLHKDLKPEYILTSKSDDIKKLIIDLINQTKNLEIIELLEKYDLKNKFPIN